VSAGSIILVSRTGCAGCDKTTLTRVLTTLVRPDSGRVEVAGVDVVADPTTARIYRRAVG
jgi:ABC-type Na+ transport system ATPase subunit NatA